MMGTPLTAFAGLLPPAAPLSGLARRTVLSPAALSTAAGRLRRGEQAS
ncbi:MAG: hypothetical protein HOW59_20870 [Nonomuraea sp.]|nr:hypothetical protein [Nonomuraea sp.]